MGTARSAATASRRPRWWTRERVLAALRYFHARTGTAPTSSDAWQAVTRGGGNAPGRRYPSFPSVLSHFATFRDAWEAAGVPVDNDHRPWSALDDWYLREGAGRVPRLEIARDLGRTPMAVKSRLIELGWHSYRLHGWSLHRIRLATGIPYTLLRDGYVGKGRIPFERGSKSFFVDPADLVELPEIDWSRASDELVRAVRRALIGRLVAQLEGGRLPGWHERCAASVARYRAEVRLRRRGVPTRIALRIPDELRERGLLPVPAAAASLGVPPTTLRYWIRHQGYPAERIRVGGIEVIGVRPIPRFRAGRAA
jgi:hypothetical protein